VVCDRLSGTGNIEHSLEVTGLLQCQIGCCRSLGLTREGIAQANAQQHLLLRLQVTRVLFLQQEVDSCGSRLPRNLLTKCCCTRPPLTSAFNLLPSMSSRTVLYRALVQAYYWTVHPDTRYAFNRMQRVTRVPTCRHNYIAAYLVRFKWLLPHSLIRLNSPVKHVSFVGAKHSAFTIVQGFQAIASGGLSCENYEKCTSYHEKSAEDTDV
jgi:hypothetical protein